MSRKDEIKRAYTDFGKAHNIYDGVMTSTSRIGRLMLKRIWAMTPEESLEYRARAFEAIPAGFAGAALEVPVGTGVLSMPVWKTLPDAEITCLDASENMVSMARERAEAMGICNVHFVQGEVSALPFPDASFDAVVSLNGFPTFSEKDAAFSEIYRVLKPGGVFCGCFYCEGRDVHTDKMIHRFYVRTGVFRPPFETPESLRERLSQTYSEANVTNVKSIACFNCVK